MLSKINYEEMIEEAVRSVQTIKITNENEFEDLLQVEITSIIYVLNLDIFHIL